MVPLFLKSRYLKMWYIPTIKKLRIPIAKPGKDGIPNLRGSVVFPGSNSRWHEAVYIVRAGSSAAAEARQAARKKTLKMAVGS